MDYQLATIAGLILGPVSAVVITLWYQRRAQKRAAKERLFVQLMAHRRSIPLAIEWTQGLNLIDVVYAGHPTVVRLWHDLYDIYNRKPLIQGQVTHKQLELLSEMARILGYKSVSQTDMDKFYLPQAHTDQAQMNANIQKEFLRVLKATDSLRAAPRDEAEEPLP